MAWAMAYISGLTPPGQMILTKQALGVQLVSSFTQIRFDDTLQAGIYNVRIKVLSTVILALSHRVPQACLSWAHSA